MTIKQKAQDINPKTRAKIYSVVAALITLGVVFNLFQADDLDAETVTETIAGGIVLFQTILARLNVAL